MKKIYRVLGKRGRITIPEEIRMIAGIGCNDILSFTIDASRCITLQKVEVCDEERLKNKFFNHANCALRRVPNAAQLLCSTAQFRIRNGHKNACLDEKRLADLYKNLPPVKRLALLAELTLRCLQS